MKSSGIVRNTDSAGRIMIPAELRKEINLGSHEPVEFFTEGDMIAVRKYLARNECAITGEISDKNRSYSGGIILSPKGKQQLMEEMRRKL